MMEQNRKPRIKPLYINQLIFEKGDKNTGKRTVSPTNGTGKTG